MAAILIIFVWIFAANDRGYGSNKSCHGCIWYINDILKELNDLTILDYCGSYINEHDGHPKNWLKAFRNPYPLLISFACILFLCWAATGALGFIAKDSSSCKLVIFYIS